MNIIKSRWITIRLNEINGFVFTNIKAIPVNASILAALINSRNQSCLTDVGIARTHLPTAWAGEASEWGK